MRISTQIGYLNASLGILAATWFVATPAPVLAQPSSLWIPTGKVSTATNFAPTQPLPEKLVSLHYKNATVGDLVTQIAKQGGVGVLIGADVTASIKTIDVDNLTPGQAIRIIAASSGLVWEKVDATTYAIANKLTDMPAGHADLIVNRHPGGSFIGPATADPKNVFDRIEIEAQFVASDKELLKQLGLDMSSSIGPFQLTHVSGNVGAASMHGPLVARARDNARSIIDAFTKEHGQVAFSAKTLAANNTQAIISWRFQTAKPNPLLAAQPGVATIGFDTTEIDLDVTPTINPDNTITVVMAPKIVSQEAATGHGIPQTTNQSLRTIANVKDGDTILLGGLRFPGMPATGADSDMVIVVSVKVIHPAGKKQDDRDDKDGSRLVPVSP